MPRRLALGDVERVRHRPDHRRESDLRGTRTHRQAVSQRLVLPPALRPSWAVCLKDMISVHCPGGGSISAKGSGSSSRQKTPAGCGSHRLTSDGLGLAVLAPAPALPAVGERVTVHPTAHEAAHAAIVRHVGRVRDLPLLGLSLVPDTSRVRDARFGCPEALPAFASAPCPWFFRERLAFRIARAGAEGMTLRAAGPSVALLGGMELDLDLHLAFAAASTCAAARDRRCAAVHRHRVGRPAARAAPRALGLPARRRRDADPRAAARQRARGGEHRAAVTYDYATARRTTRRSSRCGCRPIRPRATSRAASIADMRSPFDAHARHLTCRFGGRIVGYVRVIFVDGEPAKSQYVSWGGHEVPAVAVGRGLRRGGRGRDAPRLPARRPVPAADAALGPGGRAVRAPLRARRVRRRAARHVPRHGLRACSRSGSSSRSPAGASART